LVPVIGMVISMLDQVSAYMEISTTTSAVSRKSLN